MNAKSVLAIAAIAAAFTATAARAGEITDPGSSQEQFQSQRSRADVRGEAVQAVRGYKFEPLGTGTRATAPQKSTVTRQEQRADTAQALRQGRISYGEASAI